MTVSTKAADLRMFRLFGQTGPRNTLISHGTERGRKGSGYIHNYTFHFIGSIRARRALSRDLAGGGVEEMSSLR